LPKSSLRDFVDADIDVDDVLRGLAQNGKNSGGKPTFLTPS